MANSDAERFSVVAARATTGIHGVARPQQGPGWPEDTLHRPTLSR
jgi:hypothetical protein